MPTPINRNRQRVLEEQAKEFLVSQGCTIARGRYLPTALGVSMPGGKMEALRVQNVPRKMAVFGCIGLRCITQAGKGSAADKMAAIVGAIRHHWNIPGVLLTRSSSSEDFDRWVRWAKAQVDGRHLLFVGELEEFQSYFLTQIG